MRQPLLVKTLSFLQLAVLLLLVAVGELRVAARLEQLNDSSTTISEQQHHQLVAGQQDVFTQPAGDPDGSDVDEGPAGRRKLLD